jgi:hypothetical protein
VSTQLPRMLSCPHLLRLQFIIVQLKINPPRRLNKLQRNRFHGNMIRQSIERFSLPPFTEYCESENLYDSDPDRGDSDTARHFVVRFALQDQLIPPSPNVLTTSIIPSTLTVHRSMEVPAAPRTTSVVTPTA